MYKGNVEILEDKHESIAILGVVSIQLLAKLPILIFCYCIIHNAETTDKQGHNYHEASEAIASSLRIIQIKKFSAIILSWYWIWLLPGL